jgi:integrase
MSDNMLATRTDQGLRYLQGIKDSYTPNAKTFLNFADQRGGVSLPVLKEYFTWLNNQGYRASTVRIKRQAAIDRFRRLQAVPGATNPEQRARLVWALDAIVHENKAPKLQFASVGQEKVLSLDDCHKVLAFAKSDRQKCFLKFLYFTGARIAELTGIRLTDCTKVLDMVYISVMGKGRKERVIRVTTALFDTIQAVFKGNTFLFETSKGRSYAKSYISHELAKLTRRAIGRPLSAHKYRHSFATWQLANGMPIDALSRYLGHADTSITLKFYAHNQATNAQLMAMEL